MNKLRKKNTKKVHLITQGCDFNNNYKSKVEILLPDRCNKNCVLDFLRGRLVSHSHV